MNAHTLRNRAIRAARIFFDRRQILEVRTAKAVPAAAMEPYIDAFALAEGRGNRNLYLATSPEMAMKKIRDDPATKNHASEFTMVEWYKRDCTLVQLLQETADLICQLAETLGCKPPSGALKVLDARGLFAAVGLDLDFAHPQCFADAWLHRHGTLPHHLNELDLAIATFNLLFDECILPLLRQESGLCAVSGYPEVLGAMAYCENGVAERAEIYLQGVELANAYREEFRPQLVRDRWLRYNEIRTLRGEMQHAVDETVLSALPTLKGVAGVALGLERTIAAIHPGLTLRNFA
jgi:lysyl-tRNA synthetase class 2